jgi:hypothetical protein
MYMEVAKGFKGDSIYSSVITLDSKINFVLISRVS